jgi:transcriptional regulator with XRE-family HTH domain
MPGTGRDIHILPLMDEEEELKEEIEEYRIIREVNLEEAVSGILSEHVLIDNIGPLLAKLRIAAKMTQEDLANELGWEQSNLSRFENESYSSQTIGKVVEYTSALGVWLLVKPSLSDVGETPVEVEFKTTETSYSKERVISTSPRFTDEFVTV